MSLNEKCYLCNHNGRSRAFNFSCFKTHIAFFQDEMRPFIKIIRKMALMHHREKFYLCSKCSRKNGFTNRHDL